ncbi:MAG: hypothetical protein MK297_10730 [Planctomycetes bacterium]|nr:hypothetical protein [Planctomycetota bacterium]
MNDTHERDRVWSDAFGLALFAIGSVSCALLFKTLTHTAGPEESANWAVQMGFALLWATGPVPVSLMSLACLLLGALQFLGYQDAQRATRHLAGTLGVTLGLSIVLGAYSPDAGGRLGVLVGGGIAELAAAPLAALIGLGMVCVSVWAVWMGSAQTTAWERAQQIENPAAPLQAKADGVTIEESAALAFDGEPNAYPGVAESPYPEDVRVRGQIPEGAAALGAEETPNHDGAAETDTAEERAEDAPDGAEGADEALAEGDDLVLAAEHGDAGFPSEDLAVAEESTGLEVGLESELDDPEPDLEGTEPGVEDSEPGFEDEETDPFVEGGQALDESALVEEPDDEGAIESSEEELEIEDDEGEWEDSEEEVEEEEELAEDSAELEEEESEEDEADFEEEEELEEDSAELEEEEFEEDEADFEEEEDLEEDAAELEEEEYDEEEELKEAEYEDAAELPDLEEDSEEEAEPEDEEPYSEPGSESELEEEASPEPDSVVTAAEEQGDLFGLEEEEPEIEEGEPEEEAEVILEPQARPDDATEELLLKAADLFLERDRVAVSLLQRQFQLDFEESCAVLDELQERGLIGPYLGGNRRDILLTREEWLERVGGAT